jgi:hypothetical protein
LRIGCVIGNFNSKYIPKYEETTAGYHPYIFQRNLQVFTLIITSTIEMS